MGWFSDHFRGKYVHWQGIQFQKLKSEMFSEYNNARKQIMFATIGDSRRFQKEMWSYKHGYRKNLSDSIIEKLDMLPETMSINKVDFSSIRDYIVNDLGVTNFLAVDNVYDRERKLGAITYEGTDHPSPDELLSNLTEEYRRTSEYLYKREDGGDVYLSKFQSDSDNIERVYESGDSGNRYTRQIITYNDLSSDNRTFEVGTKFMGYKLDDDDNVVEDLIESVTYTTIDVERFYYALAFYINTDNEIDVNEKIYIPDSYYASNLNGSSTPASLEFSPIFKVLKDDGSLTDDYKRKKKKALRQFGVSIDTIQSQIDNDDINDYRVTFAVAPDDATKSSAIAKYLFHFFEEIGGGLPFEGHPLGGERNVQYEFDIDGLNVKQSFYLAEDVIDEPIFDGEWGGWKIKLRQIVTNIDRYSEKINNMYDDHISGSEVTVVDRYEKFVSLHQDDPDNSDYREWYNELPPSDYYKDSFLHKYAYAFCDEPSIEEAIHYSMFYNVAEAGDDPEYVQFWEIEKVSDYNILRKDEEKEYYSKVITVDTPSSVFIPEEDGDPSFYLIKAEKRVTVEIRKKIDENSYKRFIYTSGKLEYEVDDHTAKVDHKVKDYSFRLFMLNGYLKSKPFKEYTAIYDESMVGLAYSHKATYVKWYQRNAFGYVVQIVMIVIAVWTAGATSYLVVAAKIALAYAIAYVAIKISESVGGETGVILGVIFAMVAFYFTGQMDMGNASNLWLKGADMYMKLESQKNIQETKETVKALERFNREMKIRMIELRESMNAQAGSGLSREAIILRIANQMDVDDSGIFNTNLIEKVEEESWKMDEVPPVDYNQAETLYNRTVDIPRDVYEFEHNMNTISMFGPEEDISN